MEKDLLRVTWSNYYGWWVHVYFSFLLTMAPACLKPTLAPEVDTARKALLNSKPMNMISVKRVLDFRDDLEDAVEVSCLALHWLYKKYTWIFLIYSHVPVTWLRISSSQSSWLHSKSWYSCKLFGSVWLKEISPSYGPPFITHCLESVLLALFPGGNVQQEEVKEPGIENRFGRWLWDGIFMGYGYCKVPQYI